MDRILAYVDENILVEDFLGSEKNTMIALGMLAKAILGTATLVDGLECTPTGPASLNVLLASGSIMSLANVDGTAYGDLGSDTTHQIVKQGIRLGTGNIPATGTFAVPSTSGQSVNYLIQVQYQDVDGGTTVLPYYNAANPAVAWNGPNNTGTSNNTIRQGALIVGVKAGTAATSGSQVTPTPDAGFTGLWVVTVANGATTITSGNIAPYTTGDSNPIISEKLKDKISLATGDARYALSAGGGTRSALTNATSFYVNGSTGNDSNAGTVGAPWLTIDHAVSTLLNNYDFRGFTATLNLADGTYTSGLSVGRADLTGPLTINGNSGTPSNVVISTTNGNAFYSIGRSPFPLTVQNLKVQTTTSGWGFYADVGANFNLINIVFGACATGCMNAANQSLITLQGGITISGNCGMVVQTSAQGQFNANSETITTSGTPAWATRFALATNGSYQNWLGVTFAGSGATVHYFSSLQNSIIDTGTGNSALFPGSTNDPTPTASGGLYT